MTVIMNFVWGIDPGNCLESFRSAVLTAGADRNYHSGSDSSSDPFDVESLESAQTETGGALAVFELQRKHPHSNEITSMDAFKAFREHGPDTQQSWSFRCPVSRRARTILFTRDDHEGCTFLLILHCRVVNSR